MLFQIQEMIRTERIVDEGKIMEEVVAYNALIPDAGELSATLFIEIPELVRMSQEDVRRAVNRFQGLDKEGVSLRIGPHAVPARFDAAARLLDEGAEVRIVVDHPNYRAEASLPSPVIAEIRKDLRPA